DPVRRRYAADRPGRTASRGPARRPGAPAGGPAAPPPVRRREQAAAVTRRPRQPLTPWAFLAPYGVAVVLLVPLPAPRNVGYAFTDHTGLTRDPQFVGLANVRRLLSDGFFLDSLEASLFHVALAVPLRLLAAVGLGLLLAAPRPGGRWFRVAVYLPTVI